MGEPIEKSVIFPSGESKKINTYKYKLDYILDSDITSIYNFFQLTPLDPPVPRFQLISFLNDNNIIDPWLSDRGLRRIYYIETQFVDVLKKYNIKLERRSAAYTFLTEIEKGITEKSLSYIPYIPSIPFLKETRTEDFLKRALEWRVKIEAETQNVQKNLTKMQLYGEGREKLPCSKAVQVGVNYTGELVISDAKDIINELIFRGGDFSYDCHKFKELLKNTGLTDTNYFKEILPYHKKYDDKFKSYKNYRFLDINVELRRKNVMKPAILNKYIDKIPPTPKDFYVFRWVTLDDRMLNKYLVPHKYVLKGYISTSLIVYSKDVQQTSNNTLIRIKIPKGANVWFFLDINHESEVLLKHGETYKTVGFEKNVRLVRRNDEIREMSRSFNFLDLEMASYMY